MPTEFLVAVGEALENRFRAEVLIKADSERRAVLRVVKQNVGGQTVFRQGVLDADKLSSSMLNDHG